MSSPTQSTGGDKGKKPAAPSAGSPSTSASANGESSSRPKPAKPTKPTKTEPQSEAGAGGKAKSAKELKKEKRAALVAARGGGEEVGAGGSPDQAPGQTPTQPPKGGHAHAHAHATSSSAAKRPPAPVAEPTPAQQDVFFSHLPSHKNPNTREAFDSSRVHPTVVRLGVLMASGTLRGANARTIGMMSAFQEVIRDYQTPESAIMWKDLMSHLSPMITYLEGCRPKGQGGGNAIR
jgi:translation initiation factor eIF-2B subunit delta